LGIAKNMFEIFIVFALLVGFSMVALKYFVKQEDTKSYQYKVKGPILSSAQTAFYNALKEAVGDHGVILTKVSMANVVTPQQMKSKKQWFIANNVIAKSYFDFVVCDPRTMQPRVIIEYDNGQKLHKGKIERQRLIMQVCKSANVPLIGASVKLSYQVGKIRRLLAAHIDLIEPDKEIRFCKRCGSPMTIKTAMQGEFKGRRFFTCSRQPLCQYTENYNVVFDDEQSA
jgi:ssDNA-binding Zn-finger/Zn-ribbon topoisomerase 1